MQEGWEIVINSAASFILIGICTVVEKDPKDNFRGH
jgi:hypothetical protein